MCDRKLIPCVTRILVCKHQQTTAAVIHKHTENTFSNKKRHHTEAEEWFIKASFIMITTTTITTI